MTAPDPVVDRELEAIDAALRAGAATAPHRGRERELQELALALRSEAPKADPAFAASLRGRVEEGFPRRGQARSADLRRRLRAVKAPRVRPAYAAAASLALAVVIAVPLLLGGTLQQDTDESGSVQIDSVPSGGGGSSESGGGLAGGGRAAESAPAQPRDFAPGRGDRRIERSASLTLAAPEGELDRVANEIVAVTDRLGGFVLRSSVSTGAEGTATGDFELRLPARDLQRGLAELSRLGDVRARTQAGQDITRGFVSASDRLEAARAEREGLLRRLEQAPSDTEAEAIRSRLDANAAEIDGLRGRLRDLRLRSDFATVAVALERSESTGGADGDGAGAAGDGIDAALDDALGTLAGSLELLVRALGVLIPLGLLIGLLALGARTVRRRRREQALA